MPIAAIIGAVASLAAAGISAGVAARQRKKAQEEAERMNALQNQQDLAGASALASSGTGISPALAQRNAQMAYQATAPGRSAQQMQNLLAYQQIGENRIARADRTIDATVGAIGAATAQGITTVQKNRAVAAQSAGLQGSSDQYKQEAQSAISGPMSLGYVNPQATNPVPRPFPETGNRLTAPVPPGGFPEVGSRLTPPVTAGLAGDLSSPITQEAEAIAQDPGVQAAVQGAVARGVGGATQTAATAQGNAPQPVDRSGGVPSQPAPGAGALPLSNQPAPAPSPTVPTSDQVTESQTRNGLRNRNRGTIAAPPPPAPARETDPSAMSLAERTRSWRSLPSAEKNQVTRDVVSILRAGDWRGLVSAVGQEQALALMREFNPGAIPRNLRNTGVSNGR